MSVKSVVGAIAIMSGAIMGTGCSHVRDRAKDYMSERPQAEYHEIVNPKLTDMEVQSKLDSVAYRDVFIGTNKAKDSAVVSEFNTLAQSAKLRFGQEYESLKEKNIKTKEYEQLRGFFVKDDYMQYKVDSAIYSNFFKKHELFDKKTVKSFEKACSKIRP